MSFIGTNRQADYWFITSLRATTKMNNPASQLAALRRKVSHTCPVCGDAFLGIKKAVYCSNKCIQRAKRKRSQ